MITQFCPIGNKGCPCSPVFNKKMKCYKRKFEAIRKAEEKDIARRVKAEIKRYFTEKRFNAERYQKRESL
jgi:hypothetical protein